ncbi:MAG: diguanylate cyclase [Pseudomonadota bacterium]
MTGFYSPNLVALSLVVAIFASYTALELAGRVSQNRGKSSRIWLVGGAISMGTGVWSMHFVGMLAFHLPIALAYDVTLTTLSMLIAIAASGAALYVVSRSVVTLRNLAGGATLMGIGIAAMHYLGMHAIRMSPPIEYKADLFIMSIAIAIGASFAALWISFQLRDQSFGGAIFRKLGSAVLMGLAITGMHYTGMAAAQFAPDSICSVGPSSSMTSSELAMLIGITTIVILTITLGVSALDAHFAEKLTQSLKTTNAQLSELALYDSLTGLPNRMLLDDRMGQAASSAERNGRSFALLFIDLDRFKPVNDSYGHDVGDALLKAAAQRLISCVRAVDTVARIGGDEFVIVLSGIGDPKDAAMVSGKILDELSRPFFVGGYELDISGSIGISVYPQDAKDVKTLKAKADLAMYHAKQNGRNNYRFFAPGMSISNLA